MSEAALALGDLTYDGFLGGRIRVLQPKRGFRAAIDSVLLPAAIELQNGCEILDAGLGTGVASLCLLARDLRFRITGIESQVQLAALAKESARRNNLSIDVQCMDLFAWRASRLFDQVMTNPPYFEAEEGTQSPVKSRARANVGSGIDAWLDACLSRLKPSGVLTIIHRAERESEILAALEPQAGDIEVLPLLPRAYEPPRRILVRARKGARASRRRWPGFVLHGEHAKYTERAEAVLRHGAGLSWGDDKAGAAP